MSHTIKVDILATVIKCEELVKNIRNTIASFNLKAEVIEKIEREFNLKEIEASVNNRNSLSESLYRKTVTNINRLNNFFSNIDAYLVYNLDLQAEDYSKKVEEMAMKFLESDPSILEEALENVESEIKRSYIISMFGTKKYNSKDQLLAVVDEKLKGSLQYRQEQIERNISELSKIKNIKIDKNQEKISKAITTANQEVADENVSKAVRNRVVVEIIKIIRQQGFIVKKENVVEKGDEAVILASKPNGEEARFKIQLDGKFIYKFHKYEGMSCEKDINNFEKMFESIYGMKFENKQVIWSNPDRLDKMAHHTINNQKIGG